METAVLTTPLAFFFYSFVRSFVRSFLFVEFMGNKYSFEIKLYQIIVVAIAYYH